MQSRRLLAIIGLLAPLTLPAVAQAQRSYGPQGASGFSIFTSYDNAFPGGAGLGGAALTLGDGPLSFRAGFGFTLATLSGNSFDGSNRNSGLWTTDLDLVVSPDFRQAPRSVYDQGYDPFGGIRPYVFVGIGAHSVSNELALDPAVKNFSLGIGAAFPLAPSLSLDGELRERLAMDANDDDPRFGFQNGAEFRLGLTIHFDNERQRNVPQPPRPRPRGR